MGEQINRSLPENNLSSWLLDVFVDTRYNITWFIRDLIIFVAVTPLLYPIMKSRRGGIFVAFTPYREFLL